MNTQNTQNQETNTQPDADQSENHQTDTKSDDQQKKAKLTSEQKEDFNKLKRIVKKYLSTYELAAGAILEIEAKNYNGPVTIINFLQKTWGTSRAHAYRIVKFARDFQPLSAIGVKPTERDVRELQRLPKAEERLAIWQTFSQLENSERKFKKLVELVSAAKLASRVASNSERATQNPHQDNVASTRRSENRTGEALEPAIKLKADQFFAEAIQGLDADKKSEVLKYLQEKVQEPQQAVTEIAPPASVDAAAEGQPPEIVQA